MPILNYVMVTLFINLIGYGAMNELLEFNQPEDALEGNYFEGDIMFKDGESIHLKNALQNRKMLWPNGTVYYIYGPEFGPSAQALIQSAMSEYHKHTCIRFENGKGQGNYIIFKHGAACSSYLGMQGGQQKVSLHIPTCIYKGIVMHEIMHAIGFVHEQSRPDRDDYVNIHYDNIKPTRRPNFSKFSYRLVDTLGVKYDFASLMHYTAWTFAVDRSRPTITPKQSGIKLKDLGMVSKSGNFTDSDVLKINKLYRCK